MKYGPVLVYSNYPFLNTVLKKCAKNAEKIGVYTEFSLETLPNPLPISQEDFGKMVGELFAYGINSCQQTKQSSEKWISLILGEHKGALRVECSAAGKLADASKIQKIAGDIGGRISFSCYDDSYNIRFETKETRIILIEPAMPQRQQLTELVKSNITGKVSFRYYSTVGDCPQQEVSNAQAVFITLSTVEELAAAYKLHPKGKQWPLVIVTNNLLLTASSEDLWAKYCLTYPLDKPQVAEALRHCFEI